MKNSNRWFSSGWSFFVGVGIVFMIFVVIAIIFPAGRSVASIIGEIGVVIILLLAIIVFIFRLARK